MTTTSYQKNYAHYYDLLYQDKEYPRETDFLEILFRKFHGDVREVADIACGTGGHIIELAKRDYEVSGYDGSLEMVERARSKMKEAGLPFKALEAVPMQKLEVSRRFDAVLCLFSSIGYLTQDEDLEALFERVKKLLKPKGLFIFDCWHGNAVLTSYSPLKVKWASKNSQKILRITEVELDRVAQITKLNFLCHVFSDNKLIEEFREVHQVRYFFPNEIRSHLKAHGFDLLELSPFLEPGKPLQPDTWNMSFVAKVP